MVDIDAAVDVLEVNDATTDAAVHANVDIAYTNAAINAAIRF